MFKKITVSFLIWRVGLFLVAFLSIFFLPKFGARFPYVDWVLEITHLPNWIWGFGNFDGVHYLRIAQDGYLAQYSQAFFPLFPILIRLFSYIFPRVPNLVTILYTDPAYFYSGLILSNLFFWGAIIVFYKLIKFEFNSSIAKWSLLSLLVFPTSYYFGVIYPESLFLLLAVSSIYLIRKKKYFLSSLLIALATATKLLGVFLVAIYLIEIFKEKNWKKLIFLPIMFLGIGFYIYYLKVAFGNPLYFLTSQTVFGAGRLVGGVVLLPQVIYRYLKIFVTIKVFSLAFFNAVLEFVFTLVPLTLLLLFVKKMRFSYWFFSICTLLVPTLTGTFSSMPRYALVSIFLLLPYLVTPYKKYLKVLIPASVILGIILEALFIRGYWIA
jgi:Gpi18-like mannosyltransferase